MRTLSLLTVCAALALHSPAHAQKRDGVTTFTGVFCQSRDLVSDLLQRVSGNATLLSHAIDMVNAAARSKGTLLQGPACRFLQNQPGIMQPAGSLLVKTARLNQVYHIDMIRFIDQRTGQLHPITFWGFRLMEPNELPI